MQHKLNREEMKFVKTHQDIVSKIVITSSCSNIPSAYITGLKEINKKYGYTQCVTCNSSIFMATNSLYKDYLYSISQKNKSNKDESKRKE